MKGLGVSKGEIVFKQWTGVYLLFLFVELKVFFIDDVPNDFTLLWPRSEF